MNPITEARMSAALSKQEFSRRLRLSRTFILRAEEGCYSNPGSKLIQFSTNELKISIGEFNRRYAKFQRDTRIRRTENIEPLQIVNQVVARTPVGLVRGIYEVDLEINSDDIKTVQLNEEFKKWRESYWTSYVGFCQALCVHPASVENYEEGRYDFMPRLIVDALSEVSLLDSSFNPDLKWVYVYA
jgi:transcriptional regulator with XRE-family HTH domain